MLVLPHSFWELASCLNFTYMRCSGIPELLHFVLCYISVVCIMRTFWHKLQLHTLHRVIYSYVFRDFMCSRKSRYSSLCNRHHLWSMLLRDGTPEVFPNCAVLSTCLNSSQVLWGKFHSCHWQNFRSVFLPSFFFPSFNLNNLDVHVDSLGTVIHCSCIASYFLRGGVVGIMLTLSWKEVTFRYFAYYMLSFFLFLPLLF